MTHTIFLSIKRGLVFHRKTSCSTGHYFTLGSETKFPQRTKFRPTVHQGPNHCRPSSEATAAYIPKATKSVTNQLQAICGNPAISGYQVIGKQAT